MRTEGKYILDKNGEPVPCHDLLKWARWFEKAQRLVGHTIVDHLRISTVFLGLDHRFSGKGPPILWETMIFTNGKCTETYRCSGSREQAQAQHAKVVAEFVPQPEQVKKND